VTKDKGISACAIIMMPNPENIERGFKRLLNYALENKVTKLVIFLYAPWSYAEWIPSMREGISQNLHITLIINSYSDKTLVIKNAERCEYSKLIVVTSGESMESIRIKHKNVEVLEIE